MSIESKELTPKSVSEWSEIFLRETVENRIVCTRCGGTRALLCWYDNTVCWCRECILAYVVMNSSTPDGVCLVCGGYKRLWRVPFTQTAMIGFCFTCFKQILEQPILIAHSKLAI